VSRIPFGVYDFFGYLASGFLVLAALDLVFTGGSVLKSDMQLLTGLFWLVVAYVTGHIVANISSFLLERLLVQRLLGRPYQVLFEVPARKQWTRVFAGYHEPLPQETRERVLKRLAREPGLLGLDPRFSFIASRPYGAMKTPVGAWIAFSVSTGSVGT
jgi:hypothetical protein